MLRLHWNALRPGDRVLVHDDSDPNLCVRAGVVTLVDVHPSGRDVGIRLTTETQRARVLRPGRFAVHFDPIDDAENCWRCNDNGHRTDETGVDGASRASPGRNW
jgi:hypothetical protein